MSRRSQHRRQARERSKEASRWMAERYKAHTKYSARQLRAILVEDACKRWPTPLTWMLLAVNVIANTEKSTDEIVFASIRQECIEQTGMDMPFAGLEL